MPKTKLLADYGRQLSEKLPFHVYLAHVFAFLSSQAPPIHTKLRFTQCDVDGGHFQNCSTLTDTSHILLGDKSSNML